MSINISTFSQITCILNAILAWVFNGLLVVLIIRKSPRSMENYKYLMLIFAIFGIVFGFIDITNQPMLHFYQGAYVIFSKNPLGLPRRIAFCYIALNCSAYGMILLLLVFHFVYRYLAVCRPHQLHLFSYPYYNIFILIFIVVSLEWWIAAVFLASESEEVDEYIRETMLQNYGLTKFDFVYASSMFYRTNDHNQNQELLSWKDLSFVANLLIIIISGFTTMIFCWLQLRSRLLTSARLQNYSQKTLEMQKELLRALVAQTLLPVFLMFLPAGILLIFPIFKIELGKFEVLILTIITMEPFIDSLIPMYFIKDYRLAILRFFGARLNLRGVLNSSTIIDDKSLTFNNNSNRNMAGNVVRF